MDLNLALLTIVGILLVALLAGVEVAFALGLVGVIGFYVFAEGKGITGLGAIAWSTIYSNELACLPLFVLMGEAFVITGISDRFYKGVTDWFGRLPGSLALGSIGACGIFSAIVGSSAACAATIGTVAVPQMLKRGYDPPFVFGTLASGGALGPLIPPSVAMIIYGIVTETSIVQLFIGGAIPGILIMLIMMAYILAMATLRPRLAPRSPGVTWRERLSSSSHVVPIVLIMLVVLGGIYTGVFGITESAGIGAALCLVLAAAYRRLNLGTLRTILRQTMLTTCFVLLIVVGALILSNLLTYLGLPHHIAQTISSLSVSRWWIYAGLCVMYLVMGCFLEGISMIMITVPIMFPIIVGLGFDPIWFGVVLVILIEIGQLTPPVGINMFIIQGISGHPMSEVVRGSAPYVGLWLLGLVLCTIFPDLILWLPRVLQGP